MDAPFADPLEKLGASMTLNESMIPAGAVNQVVPGLTQSEYSQYDISSLIPKVSAMVKLNADLFNVQPLFQNVLNHCVLGTLYINLYQSRSPPDLS